MTADASVEGSSESEPVPDVDVDREEVAARLQRVYEHVLSDQRPEAVGSIERLAQELGIDIERPEGTHRRAPR